MGAEAERLMSTVKRDWAAIAFIFHDGSHAMALKTHAEEAPKLIKAAYLSLLDLAKRAGVDLEDCGYISDIKVEARGFQS